MKFELFLSKIQNNDVRFRPNPLRRNQNRKIFYTFFNFFTRNFFCFVFLLIREKRKRSILNRKRAKIPSPRPPSFLPFYFSGFARFEVFFSPVLFFVPLSIVILTQMRKIVDLDKVNLNHLCLFYQNYPKINQLFLCCCYILRNFVFLFLLTSFLFAPSQENQTSFCK